jgi:prevent-host-death family protein
MTSYSVADAKTHLPSLIDKALAGEEVIVTRHGKPVVELRPAAARTVMPPAGTAAEIDEWFRARRDQRKAVDITSVELLNQMYDSDD